MRSIASRRFTARIVGSLTLALASVSQGAILAGPISNPANGHTYFLLSQNTWTASQSEARDMGGHLATINDAAENTWVYSTFGGYGGVNRNLWIGYYDSDPAVNSTLRAQRRLEFVWISGEPVTYANWASIEPNAFGSSDPGGWEFYVHLWNPGSSAAARWNNYHDLSTDTSGNGLFGVVEIVPEPTLLSGLLLVIRRRR